jgi:hypothetical protein
MLQQSGLDGRDILGVHLEVMYWVDCIKQSPFHNEEIWVIHFDNDISDYHARVLSCKFDPKWVHVHIEDYKLLELQNDLGLK